MYWRCRHCGTRRRCWRWRRGGRGRGRGGSWRRRRGGRGRGRGGSWGRRRGVPKGSPLRWSEVIRWRGFQAILGVIPLRRAGHVFATVYLDGHGRHRMAATAATHCNQACLPTRGLTRKRPCSGVLHPLAREVLPRGHVRAIPWHAEASACQAARAIWPFLGHRARKRPSHARRRPAGSPFEPHKWQRPERARERRGRWERPGGTGKYDIVTARGNYALWNCKNGKGILICGNDVVIMVSRYGI